MKRNQWSALALAVLLFGSGIAVGALGHRYYAATAVSANGEPHSAEDFRRHYIDEMQSKLHLTPDQLHQLDAILDDTKAKFKAVRDEYRPQMMKIRNDQISRVKAILTPQQVPAYEQLVAERERRARDQEERDRRADEKRAGQHSTQTAP